MLVFPQLQTGATVQYPVRVRETRRTVVVETGGGTVWRFPDSREKRILWRLSYRGLCDDEVRVFENFFAMTEGRLKSFCFVDPTSNLLLSTEDLKAAEWTGDPLVHVAAAGSEEGRAVFRLSNLGQVWQTFGQPIAAPREWAYTFSFHVRSSPAIEVEAGFWGESGQVMGRRACRPEWEQIAIAGSTSELGSGLHFGLRVPPGAVVDIAGLQAEPQIGASPYSANVARPAIFAETRFDEDRLRTTAEGDNNNSLEVRLVSNA